MEPQPEPDHAGNTLTQSPQFLQALLAASVDMLTVSDRTGRITYASPATERVSGYTVAEFMDRHPFETIHPDDRPACEAAFARLLVTPGLSVTVQHRIQHKHGSWRWLEGTFTSLFDDPVVGGLVATLHDITTRKQMEDQVRRTEAEVRLITDSVPCLISYVDQAERYQFVNAGYEAWFQRPRDQFVGCRVQDVVGAAYPVIMPYVRRALAGEHVTFEDTLHYPDTPRTVLVQYVPDRDARGAVRGFYALVTDITDRKQTEDALADAYAAEQVARAAAEAALQTRDHFLSIASHELRTPLAALTGYTHLLRTGLAHGKGGMERIADIIQRQAQRLTTLIDQLLDVSRLQQGQFALVCHPVDLVVLVAQVVEETRVTLPEATPHRIDIYTPDTPVMIAGDASRLEQVILNLLSNAVKYSTRGGPISIRVVPTATDVVVEVEDQGIGIPQDAHTRLFEQFYRARNGEAQASGLGLGLYIAGEIVHRHGGRIEVESTEGAGSTFRVVLPLLV